MKTIAAALTAVSVAISASAPTHAAVHGLYPLYSEHTDLLRFIDVDSRRHRAGYV